jgi:hypothetical protein
MSADEGIMELFLIGVSAFFGLVFLALMILAFIDAMVYIKEKKKCDEGKVNTERLFMANNDRINRLIKVIRLYQVDSGGCIKFLMSEEEAKSLIGLDPLR